MNQFDFATFALVPIIDAGRSPAEGSEGNDYNGVLTRQEYEKTIERCDWSMAGGFVDDVITNWKRGMWQ